MIDLTKATEVATILRDIADLYEEMGVDRLQRETMREAAAIIEQLLAERVAPLPEEDNET